MTLLFHGRRASWLAFRLLLGAACISGCVAKSENEQNSESTNQTDSHAARDGRPSASALLTPADYAVFQTGKTKTEILKALQWRGNFLMATEYKGQAVSAIRYGVCGGPFADGGDEIWAVFADDKFVKFVRTPEWPKTWEKRIEIGDFSWLIRAVDAGAVSIADFEKQLTTSPAPSHVDPALTIVAQAFRGPLAAKHAAEVSKNGPFRDQFNACRLRIGMSESEVESFFKAKPLKSGDATIGSFKVYGNDTEAFDLNRDLHYSNVLVLFRNGKVSGMYAGGLIPGGQKGLGFISLEQ
jgi:hypothetical protein